MATEEKLISKEDLMATVITDEQFLRQVSKKTSAKEVESRKIVPLIKYALGKAWTFGYGLAAIQVGIPLAAAWYWLPKERKGDSLGEGHLLINASVIEKSEPIVRPGEGCLSIPNKMFTTLRYNQIKFVNDGHIFVAEGLEAQIIQHEIDHMNGVLVSDRVYKKVTVGRNDPCPCGSGKKYKKCCINKI